MDLFRCKWESWGIGWGPVFWCFCPIEPWLFMFDTAWPDRWKAQLKGFIKWKTRFYHANEWQHGNRLKKDIGRFGEIRLDEGIGCLVPPPLASLKAINTWATTTSTMCRRFTKPGLVVMADNDVRHNTTYPSWLEEQYISRKYIAKTKFKIIIKLNSNKSQAVHRVIPAKPRYIALTPWKETTCTYNDSKSWLENNNKT